MKKKLLLRIIFTAFLLFSINTTLYGQANENVNCENALPACPDSEFGQNIVSEVNSNPAPDADYYGCLGSQPNPLWYYIQISESGPAIFDLTQTTEPDGQGTPIDVDFCLWGPFESSDACNQLDASNVVDSSYDPSGIEYIDFFQGDCGAEPTQNPQNVVAGDWYILLVTNFGGDPGYINLTPAENNEAGFNCSILGETYTFCDEDGNGEETVNLEEPFIINDITEGDPNIGVTFHATSEDAWNYENVIDPIQTFSIGNDLIVYARTLNFLTNEINVSVVTFILVEAPELQDATLTFCDNDSNGIEFFDLTMADVLVNDDSEYVLTYHTSQEDADNNTNPIDSPDYYESGNAVIYVRAEAAECSATAEITLTVLESLELNAVEDSVCDEDGDGLATFNLNDYSDAILGDLTDDIKYYENESDAILGNDNFITNVDNYETGSITLYPYVAGSDGCNATTTLVLTVNETPQLNDINEAYSYCDNLSDGIETIDLTLALNDLIDDSSNWNVYYFTDENDAQASNINNALANPETFELTGDTTIYVYVGDENCSSYGIVNYELTDGVAVSNDTLLACDDGSGEAIYDLGNANITDVDDAIITYYTTLADAENESNPIDAPESFSTQVPATVFAVVTDGECSSIAEITLDYFDDLVLNVVEDAICDSDLDGVETFDLNEYVDALIGNNTGDIYFYLDQNDAEIGASNYITNVDAYQTGSVVIYVRLENGSCYAITTLTLNVQDAPDANDVTIPYVYCDDFADGTETVDLTVAFADVVDNTGGLTAEYYLSEDDAEEGNTDNAIANSSSFELTETTVIYIRVYTGTCYDVASATFELSEGIAVTNDVLYTCDTGTGNGIFDLTQANVATADSYSYYTSESDAISGTNAISDPSNYNATVPGQVYVHVETGDCENIAMIDLTYYDVPAIDIPLEFAICSGSSVVVDAGSNFTAYNWSTGQTTQSIEIDELGDYWIDVTDSNGCTYRHEFSVTNGIAPEITSVEVGTSSFTVTAEGGEAPYEYSLGGFLYQSSNVFGNLTPGVYDIYVRGADGCIGMLQTASILRIPTMFTPNGDGINDVYRIPGLEIYSGSSVRIYDRYGALIYQSELSNNEIWDGKDMSGNMVPTQDYWYIIDITDGRRLTGHVTVKNRTEKGR